MRQSIRVLGWTISIAVILVTLFLGTAVYSMLQMLINQGFGFSGFQLQPSEDGVDLSLSLFINNTSYYDISSLNLTTCIKDFRAVDILQNSTAATMIKNGENTILHHNISLKYEIFESLTYLLFEDGNFSIDTSVELRYAQAFYFKLNIPNMSVPWGAPFYNLSIEEPIPSFNLTHFLLTIPLSFENHALFDLVGMMRLEVLNEYRDPIGSGIEFLNITSGSDFQNQILIACPIEDLPEITGKGFILTYFENPTFSFGPVEKTYG